MPPFLFREQILYMGKKNVCVVFDLDDTLYLERAYVHSGFCAVGEWCAKQLGWKGVEKQAQALFDQGRRGDIFDAALSRMGFKCDAAMISRMVRIYREHAPSIELPFDSADCLARLQDQVYLGLLTDGNPVSQRAKINALGVQDFFDVTVITGDWGIEFYKPHARGYQYLESKLESCGGRFVYVADNPSKDFFAPRALGWSAIRVCRPEGLHASKKCSSGLARFEVSSLTLVPDLVAELYTTQW